MKKLNQGRSLDSLKGYSLEDMKQLRKVTGGYDRMTTTSGGSYIAAPGGGRFDDSSEVSSHE